ncbi:DUF6191 domain-containing protein [Nocardia sp. NPDC003183]
MGNVGPRDGDGYRIGLEQRQSTLMHREDPSEGAPPRDRVNLAGGSARLVARER